MDNKTLQLLKSLEKAYKTNPEVAKQVSINDIITCTLQEFNVKRCMIPSEQYFDIIKRYLDATEKYKETCLSTGSRVHSWMSTLEEALCLGRKNKYILSV